MCPLPIIRTDPELDEDCCPRPGGLASLHKIHRTLPSVIPDTSGEDVLQDELNYPIYDVNGDSILDNFKDF